MAPGTKALAAGTAASARRGVVVRLGLAVAFYLAALWVCDLINIYNFAETRNLPSDLPLVDALHARLPFVDHITAGSPFFAITDRLMFTNLSFTAVLILWQPRRLELIAEWMFLHGALLLARGLTVMSTSLPSPIPACLGATTPIMSTAIPIYCNDLMFSGHTVTNVLACMFSLSSRIPLAIKILHAVIVSILILVSIATRDHYTMDCVVALLFTCAVFGNRRHEAASLFS